LIGNRTCDLATCIIVPQPTTLWHVTGLFAFHRKRGICSPREWLWASKKGARTTTFPGIISNVLFFLRSFAQMIMNLVVRLAIWVTPVHWGLYTCFLFFIYYFIIYCSAAFLDISQAFDKVWHTGLLYKLRQSLPLNYFLLLQTYLHNRHFFIKIASTHHTLSPIHAAYPKAVS
jgi:hypothetical protein